jgi:23S rRNA (cytosine1962-C5)-methyltransferase
MQIADTWQKYTLIDAGGGERLERWGDVTVIRPDPQAFWPRRGKWPAPDMHYHRSKSGGGSWEALNKGLPEKWTIGWNDLLFTVKPTGFKHMGLFPEQAVNWQWMRSVIKKAKRPVRVLNLFAYTGGATLACLSAGADVTHIDAAKGMNAQAKENIALSGFSAKPHRVLADDVNKFVAREIRRNSTYDAIILDPPVFGRGPTGEMWRLEENLFQLVANCNRLMSKNPLFILLNAYTAGFSPYSYGNVLQAATGAAVEVSEIGLRTESGIPLPCGSYARAIF